MVSFGVEVLRRMKEVVKLRLTIVLVAVRRARAIADRWRNMSGPIGSDARVELQIDVLKIP